MIKKINIVKDGVVVATGVASPGEDYIKAMEAAAKFISHPLMNGASIVVDESTVDNVIDEMHERMDNYVESMQNEEDDDCYQDLYDGDYYDKEEDDYDEDDECYYCDRECQNCPQSDDNSDTLEDELAEVQRRISEITRELLKNGRGI